MVKAKIFLFFIASVSSMILVSCGPTPQTLAEECRKLNDELKHTTDSAVRDSIYREIAVVETRARKSFNKAELKEYARLAHPQTSETE